MKISNVVILSYGLAEGSGICAPEGWVDSQNNDCKKYFDDEQCATDWSLFAKDGYNNADCAECGCVEAPAAKTTLCTGSTTNLISAECDSTGFTITVDETCRAASYSWIDWSNTFLDGVATVVEMPASPGTCIVNTALSTTATAWTYKNAFTECNVADPVKSAPDATTKIAWNTYTVYLNYDGKIATALGTGNLQQLGQTKIECRIPANLQENAIPGSITITDTADLIPDAVSDAELWTKLQLDVYKGGTGATAQFSATPLAAKGSIELGEHVKLQINDVAGGSTVTTQFNIAIKDCWASTIANPADDGGATPAPQISFDATGASGQSQTVKFYQDQCDMFNWVAGFVYGPTASSTAAAHASNLDIQLRQFAFNGMMDDFFYHCEIDICIPTADNDPEDSGDCVKTATLSACAAGASNAPPTGRRRRAILSKRLTRDANENVKSASTGNSAVLNIDSSQCEETATDEAGLVTCIRHKQAGGSANGLSLGFLTGALVCALH